MNQKLLRMNELKSSGAKCRISRHAVKKRFRFPLHWHDYFECEILLSGRGTHFCNGQRYEASAGDVWLLSQLDFHTFVTDEPALIVNICFDNGFLNGAVEQMISMGGIFCHFDEPALQVASVLCQALEREQKERGFLCEMAQRALTEQLTVLILRHTKNNGGREYSQAIQSTLAHLHEHFQSDLSVEQLAERAGLSPNYFGMLFRSVTGLSVRDYLNKLRLRYACNLLVSSGLSTKEIAVAAGYRSVEYFFSVFKKQLCITPQQYRKNASTQSK